MIYERKWWGFFLRRLLPGLGYLLMALPTTVTKWWSNISEKGMATHSSIHAWRIPWTEEPGRLQSMGSQRVSHDWEQHNISENSLRSEWFLWLNTQHYRRGRSVFKNPLKKNLAVERVAKCRYSMVKLCVFKSCGTPIPPAGLLLAVGPWDNDFICASVSSSVKWGSTLPDYCED